MILRFLIVLFLFASCTKHIPDPKQKGTNNLYCKINGDVWKPRDALLCEHLGSTYRLRYGLYELIIHAKRCHRDEEKQEYLYLYAQNINGPGLYPLISRDPLSSTYYQTNSEFYSIDSLNPAYINITAIKPGEDGKKIIAGTFEFDLFNASTASVKITEGWFDIQVIPK